jgi:hypothetical protein
MSSHVTLDTEISEEITPFRGEEHIDEGTNHLALERSHQLLCFASSKSKDAHHLSLKCRVKKDQLGKGIAHQSTRQDCVRTEAAACEHGRPVDHSETKFKLALPS